MPLKAWVSQPSPLRSWLRRPWRIIPLPCSIRSKVIKLTGTVKQLEFVNPHAWLHLVITGPKGEAATWSFEGGSVAQLAALGWNRTTSMPGTRSRSAFVR